jgi:hypothetical protein
MIIVLVFMLHLQIGWVEHRAAFNKWMWRASPERVIRRPIAGVFNGCSNPPKNGTPKETLPAWEFYA